MTIFEQLTERQREGLQGGKVDGGTRKALFRRGLIASEGDGGFQTAELTDKGRLVLLEYAQRDNKADKFKAGDEVVLILSYTQGTAISIGAERATVTKVGENGVIEARTGGLVRTRQLFAYCLAHRADAEAAGVMGMVR